MLMTLRLNPCRRPANATLLPRLVRCAFVSLSASLPVAALVVGALTAAPALRAQAANTGAIEGRVQSAATGNFLSNARVRVAGTTREAFTNSFGEYRLLGLPAGPATLEVFFTGVAPQTVSVNVPAGGTVTRDVAVGTSSDGTVNKDGALVLSQFIVQSQRETDATAIAINEQRFAANRKDVVSTDAFGEINQGNIGEFVKFLPGITLDVKDGNTPSGIMIRGFDPNYTNVTVDGGQLASTIIANTQTSSRQFVLDGANINNVARIEVAKLPTPDMSANLLGGAVNFVTRQCRPFDRLLEKSPPTLFRPHRDRHPRAQRDGSDSGCATAHNDLWRAGRVLSHRRCSSRREDRGQLRGTWRDVASVRRSQVSRPARHWRVAVEEGDNARAV